MKHSVNIIHAVVTAFAFMIAVQSNAYSDDMGLHANSESYSAYLGIVPASIIKNDPMLVDGDESLHGGAESGTHHVMVAVFDKGSNARVVDATIITKVSLKKLLARNTVVKPLERMITSGQITYGNYFELQSKGTYEIRAMIYESDKEGHEEIKFTYVIK